VTPLQESNTPPDLTNDRSLKIIDKINKRGFRMHPESSDFVEDYLN